MKFGIIIDEIRYGGVEKAAIFQAAALNKAGQEAVLVVLRRTSSIAFKDILEGLKKVYVSDLLPAPLKLSFKFPLFRFFSFFHVTYALLLRFVSLNLRFDVIISHGTFTCFSGVALSRAQSVPHVAFIWDPVSYILETAYFRTPSRWRSLLIPLILPIGRSLDTWICTNATKVLTASRYHMPSLRSFSAGSPKVQLVLPGTDIREQVRASREPYAILATAWKPGKDPDLVLELASRIEGLRFLMVGAWLSDSMKALFLSKVSDLGLNDSVSVAGTVNEETLLDLYSRAMVFLQLRPDVGFGLPALEAAGQGCTFVIPDGQGVCDIFRDGRDGHFVSKEDRTAVAKILEQFSVNPKLAVSMGTNAWIAARAFSWEQHAKHLIRICSEALEEEVAAPKGGRR